MRALFFVPAAICFSVAGAMAMTEVGGWGWFLFVGLAALQLGAVVIGAAK